MRALFSQERLLHALETVRDPELDEPITSLGFVASCTVSADGDAEVRLRLPTYFCAPNFAYLMVADAYEVVSVLPGVRRTSVVLEDHFASDAINDGVAAQAGFVQSFDGEAVSELHGLRERRAELGLPAGDSALLLIDPVTGSAVDIDALPLHMRRARVTRVSIEANSGICRGMLRHRYDTPGHGETLLSQTPEEDQ